MKNSWIKELSIRKSIRVKITVFFLIITLSITASLAAILYWQCSKMVTKEAADQAYKIVQEASKIIDINEFVKLQTREDENKPYYRQAREDLAYIRQVSGAKYIYTMRKTVDGKIIYVIDGSPAEDMSHLGDTEIATPAYEETLRGKAYIADKIDHDEKWGALISSYYPLKDKQGTVVGLIGIDYDAESAYLGLNKFKTTSLMILGILAIIILVCGSYFSASIAKPTKNAVAYVTELANFDLTREISQKDLQRQDEFGDLARSFNHMAQKLSMIIVDMAHNSQTLAAHSEALAASGEEVNATVEEVASTATEVASIAAASFENAQQAVMESQTASHVALAGNEKVKQTVAKMNAIATSNAETAKSIQNLHDLSNQIGTITSVITDIAEQTNLLALNAAIEAARAGEQGKGFAVVADEVRKLAEQSANATKEINQLILQVQTGVDTATTTMQQGVQEVADGVKLAAEAGLALENIITSVNGVLSRIEDIQEAVKQSRDGMEQVAGSNEQITSTTQQTSAATQELAKIANQMQLTVGQFKVPL
ncbi:methyl-accepting chemotaxis protein [Desulforamulus aeronauticus]|uniref:Methyl-accepting chemotaxis protein n=1 Tax=Desulforamulus aeronauticus DSM 10349 TaxID=1121421 RepID=A0A1M6QD73_9FIRM|nr:HAMP domain-containing methyl-accepting chemotaxis protein [Desulforamulus aeronauticus]SHK18136.1 Methyl-accepting chemotaxis protein [Desulforamulus aeronauticus DSM 10349]